ncbi:LysM peptidoglycan-binding domain-containing protein [Rossellomorea sp. BNER]|uniref:LysM peptidoglycan-binding domain-containing protein n=1 Tax=Rossellomorea sp. BNER TaxID=2962031 RepID=UPI003AF2AA1C|nr:LysM peptidoglycan-binding domain-containing protein [Rossellomorea sp. BNER]
MIIHVIQRGETLWQIANRYRANISQIVDANELPDPNRLLVGQSLVVPSVERSHRVRTGETLWQIAQRYGVAIGSSIAILPICG